MKPHFLPTVQLDVHLVSLPSGETVVQLRGFSVHFQSEEHFLSVPLSKGESWLREVEVLAASLGQTIANEFPDEEE